MFFYPGRIASIAFFTDTRTQLRLSSSTEGIFVPAPDLLIPELPLSLGSPVKAGLFYFYQGESQMMQRLLLAAICILTSASALAQEPRTARISFERPTKYVDDTDIPTGVAVTYKLYQGAKGAAKTHVADINGSPVTVNTGLQPGETCWQVTAVANGVESARSNEGCKTFAFPATDAVVITVQ